MAYKIKKAVKYLGWLFTAGVLILLAVMLISKLTRSYVSIFGYSVFRIQTGSMEPELMTGDVILVKETDASKLLSGMDVTYISNAESTKGMIITHRIIETPLLTDEGRYLITTSGIAEGATVDDPIYEEQLIGKVVCKLETVTKLYSFFLTKAGLLVILIPILLIIAAEIINMSRIINGNDKKERTEESEEEGKVLTDKAEAAALNGENNKDFEEINIREDECIIEEVSESMVFCEDYGTETERNGKED